MLAVSSAFGVSRETFQAERGDVLEPLDREARLAYLDEAAEEAGLQLPPRAAATLAEYLRLVLEANERFNLTAVRAFSDAVWLHLIDSLLGLSVVEAAQEGRLVDLGSGAGFPGVPLLVATGRPGFLVESVRKKARFLEEATSALGIQARILAGRAEEIEHESGRAAVATARALAPLPSLVELASPLLRVGGRLVAYKGSPSEEELARGRSAAALTGMTEIDVVRRTLPHPERAARTLVVYERTGVPQVKLPRRTGLAQSSPLA